MDGLDRSIIDALRHDARASFADVGALVGLSASAVKRRVDRLLATGAIKGFSAIVDQSALGWTTEAFVEVYCGDRTSPEVIRECVTRHPEVVAAYTVTGDADALLHIVAQDMQHLETALERIRLEPEIQRTRSSLVLTRLLDRDPRL